MNLMNDRNENVNEIIIGKQWLASDSKWMHESGICLFGVRWIPIFWDNTLCWPSHTVPQQLFCALTLFHISFDCDFFIKFLWRYCDDLFIILFATVLSAGALAHSQLAVHFVRTQLKSYDCSICEFGIEQLLLSVLLFNILLNWTAFLCF